MEEFKIDETKKTASRLKMLRNNKGVEKLIIDQYYVFNEKSEYYEATSILTINNNEIYKGYAAMSIRDRQNGWCALQWACTASLGRAIAICGYVEVEDIATADEKEAAEVYSHRETSTPKDGAGLVSEAIKNSIEQFSKKVTRDKINAELDKPEEVVPEKDINEEGDDNPEDVEQPTSGKRGRPKKETKGKAQESKLIEPEPEPEPVIIPKREEPIVYTMDLISLMKKDDLRVLCDKTFENVLNPFNYPGKYSPEKIGQFILTYQNLGMEELKNYAKEYFLHEVETLNELGLGLDSVNSELLKYYNISEQNIQSELFPKDSPAPFDEITSDSVVVPSKSTYQHDLSFLKEVTEIDKSGRREFNQFYGCIQYLESEGCNTKFQEDVMNKLIKTGQLGNSYTKLIDLWLKGSVSEITTYCIAVLDEKMKHIEKNLR